MPSVRNPQSAIRNLLAALLLTLLLSSSVSAERLPIKTYTTDDGLNRNNIRQILQDSRGYIWLTTISGLSRFDGYNFKNYGTDQSVYLYELNRMVEDRNGGYWVATAGGPYKF